MLDLNASCIKGTDIEGRQSKGQAAYCIVIAANSQEPAALSPLRYRAHIQAGHIPAHLLLLSLHQLSHGVLFKVYALAAGQGNDHLALVGGCLGDGAPAWCPPLVHSLVTAYVP